MPDAPDVGLWTRYVLENPWPAGLLLLLAAAIMGWTGLREGLSGRLKAAAALLVLAAIPPTIGLMVQTSGEQARATVKRMIAAAEAANVQGVLAEISPTAVLALGSPNNPGVDFNGIARRAGLLQGRWKIQSNTVTQLHAYTIDKDEARVDFAAMTDIGFAPTPNTWTLRLRRQADGSMKVTQLTLVTLWNRSPREEDLRP